MKIPEATDLAITVVCKCGNTVAAHAIYEGEEIDGDFTETISNVKKRGGTATIIDMTENGGVSLKRCECKKNQK